jgi:hypothetical protein
MRSAIAGSTVVHSRHVPMVVAQGWISQATTTLIVVVDRKA